MHEALVKYACALVEEYYVHKVLFTILLQIRIVFVQ